MYLRCFCSFPFSRCIFSNAMVLYICMPCAFPSWSGECKNSNWPHNTWRRRPKNLLEDAVRTRVTKAFAIFGSFHNSTTQYVQWRYISVWKSAQPEQLHAILETASWSLTGENICVLFCFKSKISSSGHPKDNSKVRCPVRENDLSSFIWGNTEIKWMRKCKS